MVARRTVRITALAALCILGVATIAGAIRVLPWILAPNVPATVALPFARALFAVGLETTLLAAPPIGWALASATLVERGEARALFALGQSPLRVVRTTALPAAGFAALAALSALAWGTEAAAPGRLARSLIDEARHSCAGAVVPRAAEVPFVGVTWLCFKGRQPRIAGTLPGGGGAFSAANLDVSDDLRSLRFSDMGLLLGESGDLKVRVREASVQGLSPWGRASNLRPPVRALLLSSTGTALALLAALYVLTRSLSHRLTSLALGGVGPLAALLVLSRLEQGDHGPWVYLWVPAAGLLALGSAAVAERFIPRRV